MRYSAFVLLLIFCSICSVYASGKLLLRGLLGRSASGYAGCSRKEEQGGNTNDSAKCESAKLCDSMMLEAPEALEVPEAPDAPGSQRRRERRNLLQSLKYSEVKVVVDTGGGSSRRDIAVALLDID